MMINGSEEGDEYGEERDQYGEEEEDDDEGDKAPNDHETKYESKPICRGLTIFKQCG